MSERPVPRTSQPLPAAPSSPTTPTSGTTAAARDARPAPGPGSCIVRIHDAISDISEASWNALVASSGGRGLPFLDHRFLEALEHAGCVGRRAGWRPRHLALYRNDGGGERLVAAAPAYACESSDGDFSRDWAWADGAMRAGIPYYPKLSITAPFTPATGQRFLVAGGENEAAAVRALAGAAVELAREEGYSGVHVLFALPKEMDVLAEAGFSRRMSFQYHWHNAGYKTPDEFLARFDSKKRNQLKRERAAPAQQRIDIRTVRGDELAADPGRWARTIYDFHRSTVDKLAWGRGWLNLEFYQRLLARMPEFIEVVSASHAGGDGTLIAGAFNLASATHLYGRYWGCHEEHPFLHFNVCLYHSLDECIRRGVKVFEGGAGGEHKLARGFEPAETHSAHLFTDPRLDEAVRRYLGRERRELVESLARFRTEMPVLKKPPSIDALEP